MALLGTYLKGVSVVDQMLAILKPDALEKRFEGKALWTALFKDALSEKPAEKNGFSVAQIVGDLNYVAQAAQVLLTLLYYVMLLTGGRRRD